MTAYRGRKELKKVDSGISEMINGVLSNPDALNKIASLMPAVAQMMNGGGSNNLNNSNKIVETATVNKSDTPVNTNSISAENLMANAEVMAAFKNLITALNAASANNNGENKDKTEEKPDDNFQNNGADANSTIEKTLDTLKNFSSVTNPESDHRSKLLLSLKPFLKDTRQTKIDTAIKYMNAAKIINLFGKNGFV